jgi:hypothetical protein
VTSERYSESDKESQEVDVIITCGDHDYKSQQTAEQNQRRVRILSKFCLGQQQLRKELQMK